MPHDTKNPETHVRWNLDTWRKAPLAQGATGSTKHMTEEQRCAQCGSFHGKTGAKFSWRKAPETQARGAGKTSARRRKNKRKALQQPGARRRIHKRKAPQKLAQPPRYSRRPTTANAALQPPP
jgi:hypothetical protein